MEGKDAVICSDAGDSLTAAVAKAPDHPDADKALHNAALAYEIGQRFDSAMKLYERIVTEYPESEFVGKCLFQQASHLKRPSQIYAMQKILFEDFVN
jgi:TolA-binding protein